jgi:hypothetical protein
LHRGGVAVAGGQGDRHGADKYKKQARERRGSSVMSPAMLIADATAGCHRHDRPLTREFVVAHAYPN